MPLVRTPPDTERLHQRREITRGRSPSEVSQQTRRRRGEAVVAEQPVRDAARGFILDGYPRNRKQPEDLEGVLDARGLELDAAVLMEVDNEVLMKRLTGRRTCSANGKLLNIYFSSKAEIDACLRAGGTLIQRDDDKEETIRNRLQVYARQTAPLIEHYSALGLLRKVAAEGPVTDVYRRLTTALELPEPRR